MLCYDNVSVVYENQGLSLEQFSLEVKAREIVALVGASGSGKTTALRAALGMLSGGGSVTEGEILFHGQPLQDLNDSQWQQIRGTQMAIIFQDTSTMLNPIRSIGSQFTEYIRTHQPMPKQKAWQQGLMMLENMGISHGQTVMKSYPFELSGGICQRVGIAMAMMFQPQLLLADEPTSALDPTTQVQIVNQLLELRDKYDTAILLVTHNLAVAAYMADRIVIMKDGRIIDSGDRRYILEQSEVEYTHKLLQAIPDRKGKSYG